MLIHKCRLWFSIVPKKRYMYCTWTQLNSKTWRKIQTVSKEPVSIEPLHCFNSVFDSSAKPFLDISKIHLFDKFFSQTRELRCTYNFVINESVAKDIVDKISADIDKTGRIFVEGNPGVGLITINLIKSGASHVCVIEDSELQDLSLTQILNKYPDVVTQKFGNLNKDGTLILRSFDEAKTSGLTVTFILIATSYYFIRLLLVLFLKYELWSSDFEVYLVLSSTVYHSLKNHAPRHFKYMSYCAFNLLFVAEEITDYPCSAFLPFFKNNDQNMKLVKIKKNPKSYINEDELIYYNVFISVLGKKSSNFIIPTLEKWLPDCGPHLISKGISMTNQVRDLSFEESITLFKFFQSCEGYDDFKRYAGKNFE